MKNTSEIIIDTPFVGTRLDIFLHSLFPDKSRSALAKHIAQGNVLVNRKLKKPGYSLKPGDVVQFSQPTPLSAHSPLTANYSLQIPILFENEYILVIDKPAGIQVHPSSTEQEKTVVNWLIANYPAIQGVGEDPLRPGIVHRLDKDTSGVLVIAKTQPAFLELKKLFGNRKIKKEYLAVVYGVPDPASGIIDKPIARSASFRKQVIAEGRTKWKGTPREAVTRYTLVRQVHKVFKVHKVDSKKTHSIRYEEQLQKMHAPSSPALLPCLRGDVESSRQRDGREVSSLVCPVVRRTTGQDGEMRAPATKKEISKLITSGDKGIGTTSPYHSLLTVSPRTGRMHQIRVHLASIGHPIVGDKLYARKEFRALPTASRQLLHAHRIAFSLFGENYVFTAQTPKDFQNFLPSEN